MTKSCIVTASSLCNFAPCKLLYFVIVCNEMLASDSLEDGDDGRLRDLELETAELLREIKETATPCVHRAYA